MLEIEIKIMYSSKGLPKLRNKTITRKALILQNVFNKRKNA